jgi:XRE family transcriptional regulator, regulator of sulfur utilization
MEKSMTKNTENPISDGIKRLRALHKMTQTELAKLAEIPRATLANMENEQSNPSISLVLKVATALGVTVDDLISKRHSANVIEIKREDMPMSQQDNGKFTSVRASPINTQNLQINNVVMAPGCSTKGVPHPEGSHELFMCLEGTATITVQEEDFLVPSGDLIYFHGHLPHCYGNQGDVEVSAVAVVFMSK